MDVSVSLDYFLSCLDTTFAIASMFFHLNVLLDLNKPTKMLPKQSGRLLEKLAGMFS